MTTPQRRARHPALVAYGIGLAAVWIVTIPASVVALGLRRRADA